MRAIALLTACCAGACTGARAANRPVPPTKSTATTAGRAPAAAPRTTPTAPGFVDTVAPPRLVTSGHDYATILRSLLEYSNWIVEHHVDPALVTRVAALASPWDTGLRRQITALRRLQLHYDEQYDGASNLTLVSTLPDVVSARYTQPITREAWLDAHGNTRRELRPSTPTTNYVVVMALVGPDRWRLVSVEPR